MALPHSIILLMKIPLAILMAKVVIIASCHSDATNTQKKLAVLSDLPISSSKAGIGLIHFSLNKTLPLYKSEEDAQPYDSLRFVEIKTGANKGKCSFQTSFLNKKLQPYTLDEGDTDVEAQQHISMGLIRFAPQLVFRVLSKTDKGVQVFINEQTGETSFIPIHPEKDLRKNTTADTHFFDPNFIDAKIPDWFYFETWEQALKRAWQIDYDRKELFDRPNGKKIKPDESIAITVDSVQNDWIRFVSKYDNRFYGWTKWKAGDSIVVNMILNGGYE